MEEGGAGRAEGQDDYEASGPVPPVPGGDYSDDIPF